MGRDGLVFVNVRKDIVKLKRKDNLAEAPFMEHGKGTSTRWSHCSVTGRPLDRPVYCELGRLYNKDSIIELLLDRKRAEKLAKLEEKKLGLKKRRQKTSKKKLMLKDNEIPTEVHKNSAHIRDLNDIKELRIKINPHFREYTPYNQLSLGDANGSKREQGFVKHAKFQCPISKADFNGSKAFLGNWKCGHAITETVVKELTTEKKVQNCAVCHIEYKDIDLIRINPIHPDHVKQVTQRFQIRRKQRHLKQKLNKHYKKEMKLLRKRENSIKKEEVCSDESETDSSSDSDESDSSDSDDSSRNDSKVPSISKRARRGSSCHSTSSSEQKPSLDILNSVPILIDEDPILVQSSDEENLERQREEERAQRRLREFQELENKQRRQIDEFEKIIKGQEKLTQDESDDDVIMLSD